MGRAQKKGVQQPTQCTDTNASSAVTLCCAGTALGWGWSERQLVFKSASSAYQVHVPNRVYIGCHNESPTLHSLSGSKQNTADEGVAVCPNEHQVITGDHSCSVDVEQCSANSEFSNERPINITDEISPTTSSHVDSEQVIRQEWTNFHCSKICTGLQPLPLPPTYHSQYRYQSSRQFEAPQASKSKGKWSEELWNYADMERGPFYRSHHVSKTFCQHSIQETFQRPGNQELVLCHSIMFYQSSHTHKSLHYTHTELSVFERPELYIKPFIVLAP